MIAHLLVIFFLSWNHPTTTNNRSMRWLASDFVASDNTATQLYTQLAVVEKTMEASNKNEQSHNFLDFS
jgi:hypothetical protein